MYTTCSKRESILDYLFDLLPKEEKQKIEDELNYDTDLWEIYNAEREKINIESYLDNELLPHDKVEFERIMRNDSKLASEVDLRRKVNAFIAKLDDYYELDCILRQPVQDAAIKFRFKPFNKYIQINRLIAAASILLLLVLGIVAGVNISAHKPLENRLYEKFYKPFYDKSPTELNANAYRLYEAKKKYRAGDYYDALLIFENLPETLTIEVEKRFYSALIFMELEKFDTAISRLKDLLDNPYAKSVLPHIKWYLGLCYLHTGNNGEAVRIFRDIAEKKGYYYKSARKILRKLS